MPLPVDLALTLASAGIDPHLPDHRLDRAIRSAIADRRGDIDGPTLTGAGYRVELLFPVRHAFDGRTELLALAWCLVFLMGERGEIGVSGFRA